jgi:hypothetical protein
LIGLETCFEHLLSSFGTESGELQALDCTDVKEDCIGIWKSSQAMLEFGQGCWMIVGATINTMQ